MVARRAFSYSFCSFFHFCFLLYVYRNFRNSNKCFYRRRFFFCESTSSSVPTRGPSQMFFETLSYSPFYFCFFQRSPSLFVGFSTWDSSGWRWWLRKRRTHRQLRSLSTADVDDNLVARAAPLTPRNGRVFSLTKYILLGLSQLWWSWMEMDSQKKIGVWQCNVFSSFAFLPQVAVHKTPSDARSGDCVIMKRR